MSKTAKTQAIDADSRDYDLKDIENDPRITQTTKEFWITMVCYICFAALMIANLLLLSGSSVTVLGFPLWIFLEIGLIIGLWSWLSFWQHLFIRIWISHRMVNFIKNRISRRKAKWI